MQIPEFLEILRHDALFKDVLERLDQLDGVYKEGMNQIVWSKNIVPMRKGKLEKYLGGKSNLLTEPSAKRINRVCLIFRAENAIARLVLQVFTAKQCGMLIPQDSNWGTDGLGYDDHKDIQKRSIWSKKAFFRLEDEACDNSAAPVSNGPGRPYVTMKVGIPYLCMESGSENDSCIQITEKLYKRWRKEFKQYNEYIQSPQHDNLAWDYDDD